MFRKAIHYLKIQNDMELDKSPNKYLIFKTKKKIKASFLSDESQ